MKLSDRVDRMVQPIHGMPELDALMDHFLGPRKGGPRVYVPRTDIVEHDNGFTVTMEIPGVAVEDISVEVADEQLTVSGEKKSLDVDETSTVHRRERVSGKFERKFQFPTHVDFEKIAARNQDGVLVIEVPKAAEILPRKIEIAVK